MLLNSRPGYIIFVFEILRILFNNPLLQSPFTCVIMAKASAQSRKFEDDVSIAHLSSETSSYIRAKKACRICRVGGSRVLLKLGSLIYDCLCTNQSDDSHASFEVGTLSRARASVQTGVHTPVLVSDQHKLNASRRDRMSPVGRAGQHSRYPFQCAVSAGCSTRGVESTKEDETSL